ncbi:Crp/Fnr family transcriptional regulator [Mucilaginibacter litoreus]|uniref:Crp/Fnr family transcriptional regulator n=1 Tax=Mucilaginibacter litoreus TaxID=1048221 RepID=A0ABW3AY54_9SPHI
MIDRTAFINRINQFRPTSFKVTDAINQALRVNRLEAQEILLSPGHIPNALYYVESGMIRGAIDGPHEKISTWFIAEGGFLLPQNLFTRQPVEEYISAIVNTTLLVLPLTQLEKIMSEYTQAQDLILLLQEDARRQSQYREKLLRLPAARERYSYMAIHEAFLLRRVPHYLVASYLNVTRETFSRLNRGLPY